MLRGAKDIIDVCKHRIHHDPFHLSDDGDFSWEEVECLGACVNAPMAMIWKDTYEDLTPENFGKVLDGFASGKPVKPGSQIGRQNAAPEGGPRVLTTNPNTPANDKGSPKKAALTDADAKMPTEAASRREAPAPKAPMGDSTKTNPPKGDKS
jgi:NADH-quinone oxidoreductase subunit E